MTEFGGIVPVGHDENIDHPDKSSLFAQMILKRNGVKPVEASPIFCHRLFHDLQVLEGVEPNEHGTWQVIIPPRIWRNIEIGFRV
jgi:hypothetical protein